MGFTESFNETFQFVFWVSVLMMVAITFAMVYFIIRYHHSRHKQAEDIHGHLGLELTWTIVPTILVMAMFYFGYVGYQKMERIPDDAMLVETTGRMWSWSYKYDNGIETDTLIVPEGKAVMLSLKSVDVIHSFYIPAFKVKKDVVPGVNNQMWFQADIAGVYDVFCAEYCGDRHSYMMSSVKVMPQAEYDGWYKTTGAMFAPAAGAATDVDAAPVNNSARGKMLVRTKGCVACHSSDGSRLIGPSFKGLYGREGVVLVDGKEATYVANDAYITQSIRYPDAEKVKGYENMVMTSIDLTDDEMSALIDYLKELQ